MIMKNITLLKPEFFVIRALQHGHLLIKGLEGGILGKGTEGKGNG